jgi:hypothetical protein
MAVFALEFDAAASNPDGTDPGTALALTVAAGWNVTAFEAPKPDLKLNWAGSIDTDGEVRADASAYQNRTITFELALKNSTAALVQTALDNLTKKIGKLDREGGTLKVTFPSGDIRFYDLRATGHSVRYDPLWAWRNIVRVAVTLTASPLARGVEVEVGTDTVETTSPVLTKTVTGPAGDAPGPGRLVVDNDDASNDQLWVTWGIQSQYYDASANAALFYEAEGRTAMGAAAIAAGPSGASGAGSNVMRNTALTTIYQAMLSTQAVSAGAHLSHIGTFRVYARVQVPTTNTGSVSLALEWAEGDFRRYTRNAATTINPSWEGTWQLADLGLVAPTKVTAGTQRWEGRIVATSTVGGDDIDVDWLMLVPANEGSGQVTAVQRVTTPTTFSAQDGFDQSAGALTGKTLPTGGTWTAAGDTDDFTVNATDHIASRTALSDAARETGRYVWAGTPTLTLTVASVDFRVSTTTGGGATNDAVGLVARLTDVNNWWQILVGGGSAAGTELQVWRRVAGTLTPSVPTPVATVGKITVNTWYTLTLRITAQGVWSVWLNLQGATVLGSPVVEGIDTTLATGGSLASGKVGIYDFNVNASPAYTRDFDNFSVWVPPDDAAIFKSQSLELRHDRVRREDSGGTLWVEPSSYEGRYLTVPPAGAEARTARVIVKASRGIPGELPDGGTDDISARLFVTPRYL